jgi:hypothetical protein
MRLGRIICALACPLAGAGLFAGCGSGGSGTAASSGGQVANTPAPPKSEFPASEGHSLQEVLESMKPSKLIVSPGATVFYTGKNRFPFGVFEKNRTQVGSANAQLGNAKVALYFAKVPKVNPKTEKGNAKGAEARSKIKALEEPATGPFPAKIETLATKPAFRAKTTVDDPNAGTAVYSTELDFPSNGDWRIAAVIKEGSELSVTLLPTVVVGEFHHVPRPGQKAPLIHTPTPADVGGDLSKITTRIPPDTQNRVDYAEVLGKEPIFLLFATPKFCQSRVCGPVVDVAEQLKQTYGDKAAFIHMEIYNENNPSKHVRPQVKAFHLPSEPWLFAIGRDGRVKEAIEGAFGVDEMTRVVKKVIGE